MLPEEYGMLTRGTRVMIGPELRGSELYGMDDPEDYEDYLLREGTVGRVYAASGEPTWFVEVQFDDRGDTSYKTFIMEEIQCICEDDFYQIEDIDADDFSALLVFADDSESLITTA